ncbi:MAG: acyl-ACP--UDP-N-acetylglucosamine O-acyltransferase [Thermoguttaceae bacterium]|jgi:UDP-N-acetylglucosamine acyltransferase
MNIHPTALIGSNARLGADVRIGPFSVVEDDVTLGDRCVLESHVAIKSGTALGSDNHVFEGAVLGGLPQHVHMPERPGRILIGSGNTIREHVTIHRPLEADHRTTIGDHCLLMANAHVGHDCAVAHAAILTNNVMLGGHVTVGPRAFVSGGVAIHQFCRVGSLAMVGGQARIVKDVPPFVTIDGQSGYVVGLNQVGLKRAGYDQDVVVQLKAAYRLIYRSGLRWDEILRRLREEFSDGLAAQFHAFLSTTQRGIIPERRMPPGATLKLHPAEDEAAEAQWRIKAG